MQAAHASAPRAEEGSFLQRFFAATEHMSPEARGAYLERPPPEAPDIDEAHRVRPARCAGCAQADEHSSACAIRVAVCWILMSGHGV